MNVAKRPCNLERDGMPDTGMHRCCGTCMYWETFYACDFAGMCAHESPRSAEFANIDECVYSDGHDCHNGRWREW